MKEDFSNKILERIEEKKIKQLPRWRFLILRMSFWFFASLSVVFGSISFGAILFLFADFHKHGLLAIPHEVKETLTMIPFAWIIVFGLFILSFEESIKHTKNGYKYRLHNLVSIVLLLSIIFGIILNFFGIGKMTHESLNNIQAYTAIVTDSKEMWRRPEIGRLAGTIISIKNKNNFSVVDFRGHIWKVHIEESADPDKDFAPVASSTVRMFGVFESSSSLFIVNAMSEWEE